MWWLNVRGTVPARGFHRVLGQRRRHRPGEDVALVVRVGRQVGERCSGTPKFLARTDRGGVLREPVGEQERFVLREVAVVEDEQELAALLQSLNRVRYAGGEVPQVADPHVVDEVRPILVDGGDTAAAGEHVGPLRLLVPVQLTDAAGLEAHVDPGKLGGDGQLPIRHLARPAAGEDTIAGGGEGELEIRNGAVVGLRRGQQVGVLPLQRDVVRSQDGRTQVALDGLGQAVTVGAHSPATLL